MPTQQRTELVTVAARGTAPGGAALYCFNESARVFTLADSADAADDAHRLLARALEERTPVKVRLDLQLPLVHAIEVPLAHEVQTLRRARPPLPLANTAAAVPIEVDTIDPVSFNAVGPDLDWPIFGSCERIVPDVDALQALFDFCAGLACYRPAPPAAAPCIPFQYVKDGCAARAHQMRRIITERFGYCCEKVFAYSLPEQMLAVRASRWGDCCVVWWYHVAPLVRMRSSTQVLAMVIDPSIFEMPVLLSQWLQEQEDRNCKPNARVVAYAVQDGRAYLPGWNDPYMTDPGYQDTEEKLRLYAQSRSC